MKSSLHISELFYSLQGEGKTTGTPAIFIRLSGCNILCKSDSWVCDTIEVWKKGTRTYFKDVLSSQNIEALRLGAHLIFTGGEPLLHQSVIKEFLLWLNREHSLKPIIEVETNGTIMPTEWMISWVDFWNCSPKLENSGVKLEKRQNPFVIQKLNTLSGTSFKFVVKSSIDVVNMMQEYGFMIDMRKVILMPAGETQSELKEVRQVVAEQALNLGVRFCDRMHITIWNKKTGV